MNRLTLAAWMVWLGSVSLHADPQPIGPVPVDPIKQSEEALANQLEQIKDQTRRSLQPLVFVYLDRVRLTGEIPVEKRPIIRKRIEDELVRAIDEQWVLEKLGAGINPSVRRLSVRINQKKKVNYLEVVRLATEAAVAEHLPPEQAARYREEEKKRDEEVKQAVIKMLVWKHDYLLRLAKEQRQKLAELLNDRWRPEWASFLFLQNYGVELPEFVNIGPKDLEEILTPKQQAAWKELSKTKMEPVLGQVENYIGIKLGPRDDYWGKPEEPMAPAAAAAVLP